MFRFASGISSFAKRIILKEIAAGLFGMTTTALQQ